MDNSNSLEDIKSVLKYSKNLIDFILTIDEKKTQILKLITNSKENEDKTKLLIINEILNIDNIFNEPLNENIINALNRIKEFENKNNKIFLNFYFQNNEKKIYSNFIRQIIVSILIGFNENLSSKYFLDFFNYKIDFNSYPLNNFEILEINKFL